MWVIQKLVDKNLLESKDKRGAAKDPQDREENQNQPLKNEELQPRIFPLTDLGATGGEAEVADVGHHPQHFHQVEDPDKHFGERDPTSKL